MNHNCKCDTRAALPAHIHTINTQSTRLNPHPLLTCRCLIMSARLPPEHNSIRKYTCTDVTLFRARAQQDNMSHVSAPTHLSAHAPAAVDNGVFVHVN